MYDKGFEQKLKKAAAFCTAGILGGQLGAQSRAAWLTCIASAPMAFAPYAKKSLKYLTVVLSIVALIIGVFAVRPHYMKRLVSSANMTTDWSNTHRLWLWESCVNMFRDHPVNGIGLGNFQMYYRDKGYWMHNGKGEPTPAELRQKAAAAQKGLKKPTTTQPKAAAQKQAPVKKAAPVQKPPVKSNAVQKQADAKPAPAKQNAVQKPAAKQKPAQQKTVQQKPVVKKPVQQKQPVKQNTPQKRVFVAGHAHNSYFQLLAETGVIGFAGLLLFVLYYLGNSLRNWFKEKQPYDLMFFTSFLSFFVLFAQVEHIVDNSAAVRMMWFLLAILLQMKALKQKNG